MVGVAYLESLGSKKKEKDLRENVTRLWDLMKRIASFIFFYFSSQR